MLRPNLGDFLATWSFAMVCASSTADNTGRGGDNALK